MVLATGRPCALWFMNGGEGHSLGQLSLLAGSGGPSLLFKGAVGGHHCCWWSMWVGGGCSAVVRGRCCMGAVGGGAVLGDCSWVVGGGGGGGGCLCPFAGAGRHLSAVVTGCGGGVISGG